MLRGTIGSNFYVVRHIYALTYGSLWKYDPPAVRLYAREEKEKMGSRQVPSFQQLAKRQEVSFKGHCPISIFWCDQWSETLAYHLDGGL